MNRSLVFAICTSLLLVGCGKKESASVPVAEAAPSPAAADPQRPIEGIVDPFMTAQLQIFIQQRGRMPVDFNEFASARMDSVPMPPPGASFVVDQVTREVKLAPIK